MHSRRYDFTLTSISNQIFAIGGIAGGNAMNTMEIINLDIDSQWKQHEMPFSVDAHCSVRLGNKIIVTGGWDGHSVSKLNL